jgi:probable phosphoglycerate mutase
MISLMRIDHDPFGEKKDIMIIRHGSTALNAGSGGKDRIRGWRDVPLSPKGEQEIKATAEKLADSGLQVLVHSDLSRAAKTAQAVSRTTGATSIPSPALRPWNVGHFTGRESDVVTPKLRDFVCRDPDEPIPGGEAFNTFKERVFTGVRQALQIAGNASLALVTHHRVDRLLAAWEKAGQSPDLEIDPNVMFTHGEPPASFRTMVVNLKALTGRGAQLVPVDHDPFAGVHV